MNTHLHLHIDPNGFDISKFMHGLNTAYVHYYNKRYNRHGHVMQERFQSRIVDNDLYNLALSAYIHNNPRDIKGYEDRASEYSYSSYGIYLGLRKDEHKIIDKSLIFGLFGCETIKKFVFQYHSFVERTKCDSEIRDILESISDDLIKTASNEYISGRKTILREMPPAKIIAYISDKIKLPVREISTQCRRKHKEFRAFIAYVLRVLCGFGYRQICETLYNITISGCSKLCSRGYNLITNDKLIYGRVFDELISL